MHQIEDKDESKLTFSDQDHEDISQRKPLQINETNRDSYEYQPLVMLE